MSSLVNLPSGETLDYWWERLRERPNRKRFLATKILEVLTYKSSAQKRDPDLPCQVTGILQMEPRLLRNGVHQQSSVCVVVPAKCTTRTEVDMLTRLIAIMERQSAKLILVNDGSTNWPELKTGVTEIFLSPSKGPAAARNAGITAALDLGADVILMTDIDCIPETTWVAEAVNALAQNPCVHLVSGLTQSHGTTWFARYHDINGTLNGRRFKNTKILLYGPTCNLAITRQVAQEIHFDESYKSAAGEDIDFCLRAMTTGFRTVHCESMKVTHDYQYQPGHHIANSLKFVCQFKKYATAESQLLKKFPAYFQVFAATEEIASP